MSLELAMMSKSKKEKKKEYVEEEQEEGKDGDWNARKTQKLNEERLFQWTKLEQFE